MKQKINPAQLLIDSASVIFWDFDGVIKESLEIKTLAYQSVFSAFGSAITERVRDHHETNSGVSRFEKIPLYLGWAGQHASAEQVHEFCVRFSETVLKSVINSPWVPGVHEYILKNFSRQDFVIVTATPQEEIEIILADLNVSHCFKHVYGAPTKKADAIQAVLSILDCSPDRALMIGDAEVDLLSAEANAVPFVLRRNSHNLTMQVNQRLLMIDHLNFV